MASDIRSHLPLGAGGSVSTQIVRYSLHKVRLRTRVPAAQHRASRLTWCHRQITSIIEWHWLLFTDDSHFCLGRNDGCRGYDGDPKERY
ncbi:hypothetical protein TNCV_178701 [Trichonephila clavipes]|nr:hypothetical protein TNCV_178701 [Trichonephila clavipes]